MNRFVIFVFSLLSSVNSFAQWSKPSAPAKGSLTINTECYLYNKDAGGFLTGANEWGTRASISEDHGWKITLDIKSENYSWDGESYYIISQVENGENAGNKGYMFADALNEIFLDKGKDDKENNVFSFIGQSDGTYKIGLSDWNKEFTKKNYPDTYLGCIYGKKDSRVYLCTPDTTTEKTNVDSVQTIWYVVTSSEYKKYIDKLDQYKAALALGETLEEAKKLDGIDEDLMFDANFAYEHTFSETNDLITLNERLIKAVKDIKLATADITNPIEVLSIVKSVEQTFDNTLTTGWTMDTEADNKQASNGNGAKDIELTGNHLENWRKEALGSGTIWAKLTDIPNGVYKLTALAFTNDSTSTFVFAGNDTTYVKSSVIDIDKQSEILTIVENNELTFGMRLDKTNANWVGLDNVNLYYLGNKDEAYKIVADSFIVKNKDYKKLIENSIIPYYSKESYNAYIEAINELKEAIYAGDITKKLTNYKSAIESLYNSIIAYEEYSQSYINAGMWLTAQTIDTEQVKKLEEYINGTDEPIGFNGFGNATHILEYYDLNTSEIINEKIYLDKLYDDAYASIINEGEDCTKLIKNPNFSEEKGWTSAVGPTWPTGDTEVFPVFEAWNMVCDIYQEMSNLQNGLYEMEVYAALRPGNEYNEENINKANAYIYINTYKEPIPCADIKSADEASNLFAEDNHKVKVYGIVTDGTMRLGICNKIRSAEGCRLWGGSVTLKYHAKNPTVLSEAITHTLPYAKKVYNNSVCGNAEKEALAYAINFANQEDDPFEELINLKNSIDAVEEGKELYNTLDIALRTLNETLETSTADTNTKNTLQEIHFTASNLLTNHELSNNQAREYIAKVYESIVIAKRYGYAEGTADNPVDYSELILNNNFDPSKGNKDENRVDGWSTTSMNGYKLNTISYNRSEYELNQTIYGLKKGTYKVTVNGYYRAGYALEDEKNYNDTIESHLATLYATTPQETYSTKLMNLTEGATSKIECTGDYVKLSNGLYVPNSSSSSAEYFSKNYYLNELVFELKTDGPVKIGISKKGIIANDYSVIGKWGLWNMGIVNDDIIAVSIDETYNNSDVNEVYSTNGIRIAKPTTGINIVKMNDGTVKKIIIR